jgi:hypothetical protein
VSEWQLREYTVQEGHLDDFVADWTAGVLPLRHQFGFSVRAWAIPEESRFVWVVGYDGPEGLEAADRAYYASPERVALQRDPARWLTERRHAGAVQVAP